MKFRNNNRRRAVAALELALLMPFFMSLLFGIWEVGRYLDAMIILEGAAREGGRQASAGSRLDPVTGNLTLIYANPTPGSVDVRTTVLDYLERQDCDISNVTVTYENLSSSAPPYPYTDKSDPYEARRLDELRVTVTMPYRDIRWTPTEMFIASTAIMTVTVNVYSMRDDEFNVNSTIPNN